jgi:DNA-binding SARP family transcriptional activator
MALLSLTLLGGFQARLGDRLLTIPTRKSAGLFAYLAIRSSEVHLRDKLASLLWGGHGHEEARHSLRQSLSGLRTALSGAQPVLKISRSGVMFDARFADIDVLRFERLASRDAPRALKEAVALYRGDLLDGLDLSEEPFEEWLRNERARLREHAVGILTRLASYQAEAGEVEAAIQTAVRLVGLDPLREEFHRLLISLYARRGRIGDAVQQYRACTSVLRRELGVEPTKETQRVYYTALSQGRSALTSPVRVASGPTGRASPAGIPPRAIR